jgi:4-hydroxybenzoyl-CoA thioesterase
MTFHFAQKVLFRHCDPAGIVFYPRYFEMINDCVEAFFDSIGYPFEALHQQSGVPTAEITARFSAPSRHGDHLDITLDVTQIGRSSAGLEVAATCGAEQRFKANSTLVHIQSDGRSSLWPDDLRTALIPYLRSDP